MNRSIANRTMCLWVTAGLLCFVAPVSAAQPASAKPEVPRVIFEFFQKEPTWAEAMLGARQRYRNWRETDHTTPQRKPSLPSQSVQIALRKMRLVSPEWAKLVDRFLSDLDRIKLPGDRGKGSRAAGCLDWFDDWRHTELERALITNNLNDIASYYKPLDVVVTPLRTRLNMLCEEQIAPDNPKWLELYAEVSQWAADLEPLQGMEEFRRSVDVLAGLFGGEFLDSKQSLLRQLAQLDREWTTLSERLDSDPESGRQRVLKLVERYAALRDRVHFGLATLRDFLESCTLDMRAEWMEQMAILREHLRVRDWFSRQAVQEQAMRKAALILAADRDPADVVLRRTRALLDELRQSISDDPQLARYDERLCFLEESASRIDVLCRDARDTLYYETCRLRREIAVRNPLLDFGEILFVKRHFMEWGAGPAQKQYFGHRAHGGGGLFVLQAPFGQSPKVKDLLADSVCKRGRLQGRKLTGGDFVSPELSYDARTVFFSYTENHEVRSVECWVDPPRTAENTYHVFKVGADGSNLEQLTDGPFNDVDPCLLPNGRIVFISERRGGGGRSAADRTYTLHGMATDGSDLVRLSDHETNEWQPSVGHDGKILYTRWDMWDRAYFQAMNLWTSNNFGIYLVDAFGNRELLYRDPQISCLSPIPLRPRGKPPEVATALAESVPASNLTPSRGTSGVPMATVGLADVYRSYYTFPTRTKIEKLRIVQVAYKTITGRNIPVTGYGDGVGHDKGGRMVLGTVPVEEDGSAYFRMPAGVPVNFQAIGDDGLAVQTMHSVTYAQPRESLVCLGCHEPRQAAPSYRGMVPRAFLREPSEIEPDVEGSYPLTFPRLVQPVLDRHCVACHQEHPGETFSLARGTKWREYGTQFYDRLKSKVAEAIQPDRWHEEGYKYLWYDSYINLYPFVQEGCFVEHSNKDGGPRTKPGTFGARMTRLYQILQKGHYDVKLTDEELHRIALWIDTNCRFFGAVEGLLRQAEGEVVMPAIE